MIPDAAIHTITVTLRDHPSVRALLLSGSHGSGLADAHSDIDFVLVTPEGATDEMAALWREAVGQTGEVVLWWDRQVVPVLINAITADWLRIDVLMLKSEQLTAQAQDRVKVLFDHDGTYATLKKTTVPPPLRPAQVQYQIEDFIRILGLISVADGRKDYVNGVTGVLHLRRLLTDLLIAENNVANRGGALHLNRLITTEQSDLLATLPVPEATRDSVIAAHLAYAGAYLPRARRLAVAWGVTWPEAFEAATWAHLARTLDVSPPYPMT